MQDKYKVGICMIILFVFISSVSAVIVDDRYKDWKSTKVDDSGNTISLITGDIYQQLNATQGTKKYKFNNKIYSCKFDFVNECGHNLNQCSDGLDYGCVQNVEIIP
jgi:hypothetical protein